MTFIGTKFIDHDSSLCVLDNDKKSIFAISAERFSRKKHCSDPIFPILKYLIESKTIDIDSVKGILHSFASDIKTNDLFALKLLAKKKLELEEPMPIEKIEQEELKLSQLLKTKKINTPSYSYNNTYAYKAIKYQLKKMIGENIPLEFKNHQLCHAMSGYHFAPFNTEKSLVFVLDGHGDGIFSSLWEFEGKRFKKISESEHQYIGEFELGVSIGSFYSFFTKILGFYPLSDEGKVEALAAFGKPDTELLDQLNNAIFISLDKLSFTFNEDEVNNLSNYKRMEAYKNKIGRENFAATIQFWLEDIIVRYLKGIKELYPIENIVLTGGVCANVIMNLKIFEANIFKNIHISPFSGDEGGSIGSAILKSCEKKEDVSWLKNKQMPYFGTASSREEVLLALESEKWKNKITAYDLGDQWPKKAAEYLNEDKIIGVFHGNMEFGPRALGNRSILGSAYSKTSRDRINNFIKKREKFQPFCPSILEEDRSELFKNSFHHKYMAIAFRLKEEYREKLNSACHVDGTARAQFVTEEDNPAYYHLLKEIKKNNTHGIVLNTSFNLHGRSIVLTPDNALTDLIDCDLDALFIEGFLVIPH